MMYFAGNNKIKNLASTTISNSFIFLLDFKH